MQHRPILDQRGLYDINWLRINNKECAPFPAPTGINLDLLRSMEHGCQRIKCPNIVMEEIHYRSQEQTNKNSYVSTLEEAYRHLEGANRDILITTPDCSAAMFVSTMGYALIAGVKNFMTGVAPFSVDGPREDFEYYAGRHPNGPAKLFEVAREYAPRKRSWRTASEVPSDSCTGKQLQLMEDFIHGRIDGSAFARQWLDNRSQAINEREMLSFAILYFLSEVFYAIDDSYTIDPSLRDEDDMTDEQLREVVRTSLTKILRL